MAIIDMRNLIELLRLAEVLKMQTTLHDAVHIPRISRDLLAMKWWYEQADLSPREQTKLQSATRLRISAPDVRSRCEHL